MVHVGRRQLDGDSLLVRGLLALPTTAPTTGSGGLDLDAPSTYPIE